VPGVLLLVPSILNSVSHIVPFGAIPNVSGAMSNAHGAMCMVDNSSAADSQKCCKLALAPGAWRLASLAGAMCIRRGGQADRSLGWETRQKGKNMQKSSENTPQPGYGLGTAMRLAHESHRKMDVE